MFAFALYSYHRFMFKIHPSVFAIAFGSKVLLDQALVHNKLTAVKSMLMGLGGVWWIV